MGDGKLRVTFFSGLSTKKQPFAGVFTQRKWSDSRNGSKPLDCGSGRGTLVQRFCWRIPSLVGILTRARPDYTAWQECLLLAACVTAPGGLWRLRLSVSDPRRLIFKRLSSSNELIRLDLLYTQDSKWIKIVGTKKKSKIFLGYFF